MLCKQSIFIAPMVVMLAATGVSGHTPPDHARVFWSNSIMHDAIE